MAPDDFDDNEYAGDCGNCGGEGYVANCQDEIGCIDPESGCDLCIRRCDWCRPRPALEQPTTKSTGAQS